MAKKKDKDKYPDNTTGWKKAWEDCTEKQKDFIMYYLGVEKPQTGYDCYGNRTRAYYEAYFPEETENKIETKKVNDDGDVEIVKEYTSHYKSSMTLGSNELKKIKIKRALKHIRDRFEPLDRIKEIGSQRSDMGLSLRASTKLLEITGEAPDEGQRLFRSFARELAKANTDLKIDDE